MTHPAKYNDREIHLGDAADCITCGTGAAGEAALALSIFESCVCLSADLGTHRVELCDLCFDKLVAASGAPPPATLRQSDGRGVIILELEHNRLLRRVRAIANREEVPA